MPNRYDKDPYIILGVSRHAADGEIKQTYRRLARQYHPDLNKDPRAAERMKEVNWAYSILGDPKQRTTYDFWRRVAEEQASSPSASRTPSGRAQSWPGYSTPRPRAAQSSGLGLGTILACWLLYSLISTALRFPVTSLSPSPLNFFTQTAQAEVLHEFMLTFSTTHQVTTPIDRPSEMPAATLPAPTVNVFDAENIRAQVVPSTIEWEWIYTLLSEYKLTTPTGLSSEVLRVRRNADGNIFVETRNNGAFFIYINADKQPVLIPLSITPMP